MHFGTFSSLFLSISSLQWASVHAMTDLVPRAGGDLCFLIGHELALVGDRLFFMYGNYTFEPADTATAQPYLFYLDLSKSFPVEQFMANGTFHTFALPSIVPPSPMLSGRSNRAVLWFSNDSLYIATDDKSITSFDMGTNQWQPVDFSGAPIKFQNFSPKEISVSVPYGGLTFSFGQVDVSGLVRFDASKPDALKWTRQPAQSNPGAIRVPDVRKGEMVYVPMGTEGVLVLIGGYDVSPGKAYQTNIPMSQISVYDIASSTWYSVTATGSEIPNDRALFCAVVSASPDKSSFQITIYGGFDSFSKFYYDDVFILTLPSFRWIRVNTMDDFQADTAGDIGRARHRCVTYNDAQMFVIGGWVKEGAKTPGDRTECKPKYPPIRILDTTTYTWKREFDPSVAYHVPDVVTNIIGGDTSGNANVVEPEGGFNLAALNTIFSQLAPPEAASTSANSSSPSENATSKPSQESSQNSSSQPHAPAIAGGVVGGVVAIGALLALIYFIYKRRSNLPQDAPAPSSFPEQQPSSIQEIDSYTEQQPSSIQQIDSHTEQQPSSIQEIDSHTDQKPLSPSEKYSHGIQELNTPQQTSELDSPIISELAGSHVRNEMYPPTGRR